MNLGPDRLIADMAEWDDLLAPHFPKAPADSAALKVEEVFTLGNTEVFDLPMIGGEQVAVEQEYQRLTGGPAVRVVYLTGFFVDRFDGTRFRLHEWCPVGVQTAASPVKINRAMTPALELPRDSVFVVRRTALEDFVKLVTGQASGQNSSDSAPAWNPGTGVFSHILPIVGEFSRAENAPTKPNTEAGRTLAQPSGPEGDLDFVGGPNLAAWMKAIMEQRDHMSLNQAHVLSTLDRKTIKAMLAGKRVRRMRLRKLVQGLSTKEHALDLSKIPID